MIKLEKNEILNNLFNIFYAVFYNLFLDFFDIIIVTFRCLWIIFSHLMLLYSLLSNFGYYIQNMVQIIFNTSLQPQKLAQGLLITYIF